MGHRQPGIVATLQGAQVTFSSEKAWARQWAPLVEEAARRGAQLAVLSGSPGWDEASDESLQEAGKLASECGLWLVADLGPDRDSSGAAYPALHVIDATGRVAGVQRQIHLSTQEQDMLFSPGEELFLVDSPVGVLGLLRGPDVLVPEVSRALVLLGAEVLIHVGTLPSGAEGAWMARLWREVQANQVFGIEAYAVGHDLAGRSAILAPVEMTPDGRGVLAQAPDLDGEATVVAQLNWEARDTVVARYPILEELNLDMVQRQLLSLYRKESSR